MAERNRIADKVIAEDLSGVTIKFLEGESVTLLLEDIPEETIKRLALHGASQKLGDSYSGEDDIEVARARALGVANRLKQGDWKAVREGSGGSRISDLARALAAITGNTVEQSVAVIEDMDKAKRAGLRRHPKIAAELARMAAERAQEKANKAAATADSTPPQCE